MKIKIPVAIDDCGYASWSGDNWRNNEGDSLRDARVAALEKCRTRPRYIREDRLIIVEIDVDLNDLFNKEVIPVKVSTHE